jgi:hypothetical protein
MGFHPILLINVMRQALPSIYHKASLGVVEIGPVFLDMELGETQCPIEEEYLAPKRRFIRPLK